MPRCSSCTSIPSTLRGSCTVSRARWTFKSESSQKQVHKQGKDSWHLIIWSSYRHISSDSIQISPGQLTVRVQSFLKVGDLLMLLLMLLLSWLLSLSLSLSSLWLLSSSSSWLLSLSLWLLLRCLCLLWKKRRRRKREGRDAAIKAKTPQHNVGTEGPGRVLSEKNHRMWEQKSKQQAKKPANKI